MFKRKKNELEERIVLLNKRIQDMSEVIHDFENNQFKVSVDEYGTLITNNTNSAKSSKSIEIDVSSARNIMEEDIFAGKEMTFTLKHPRTYR